MIEGLCLCSYGGQNAREREEVMKVECQHCGKEFKVVPSEIKKGGGKYCSKQCSGARRQTRVATNCQYCGKEFRVKPSVLNRGFGKYCSRVCRGKATRCLTGNIEATYDGHTYYISTLGYPYFYSRLLGELSVHRYVARRILRKPLPKGAVVHHIDEDRLNFSNDNLVVLQDNSEHTGLHARLRVQKAGGNWRTQKICSRCKQLLDRSSFNKNKTSYDGLQYECKECSAKKDRRYRTKRKQSKPMKQLTF